MSDRYREFALQCGAWHQVYDQKQLKINEYFNYEKFADLIVQDCINVIDGAVHHREPASTYVDKIKEHFQ